MNAHNKTNWTPIDEERFQEMAKLREDILAKNTKPVLDLVLDMLAGAPKNEQQYVEFIKMNANRIRDVLDPFDSGERPPSVIAFVSPPMPCTSAAQPEMYNR